MIECLVAIGTLLGVGFIAMLATIATGLGDVHRELRKIRKKLEEIA
jgi:hypothetical protein